MHPEIVHDGFTQNTIKRRSAPEVFQTPGTTRSRNRRRQSFGRSVGGGSVIALEDESGPIIRMTPPRVFADVRLGELQGDVRGLALRQVLIAAPHQLLGGVLIHLPEGGKNASR